MKLIRQGDVLLKKIHSIPHIAKKQDGPCILAYGEVTGHLDKGDFVWRPMPLK